MQPELVAAQESDFEFAFHAKRDVLGPHIASRWGWDEELQRKMHQQRWSERPWFIIAVQGRRVGTVSIEHGTEFIRFGEFYILPEFQGQGLGTNVLACTIAVADAKRLPVKLEYLKWNPVASLYRRFGFEVTTENETHYFVVRIPGQP
jgi:GNAT superfamily N-acetyltransferase